MSYVESSVTCDECNRGIGDYELTYCEKCMEEKEDQIEELENQVEELEKQVEELKEQIKELESKSNL